MRPIKLSARSSSRAQHELLSRKMPPSLKFSAHATIPMLEAHQRGQDIEGPEDIVELEACVPCHRRNSFSENSYPCHGFMTPSTKSPKKVSSRGRRGSGFSHSKLLSFAGLLSPSLWLQTLELIACHAKETGVGGPRILGKGDTRRQGLHA